MFSTLISAKEVLYVLLAEDGQYLLSIGGVVDVPTSEELVDDALHLVVVEYLPLWNGGVAGKTDGK